MTSDAVVYVVDDDASVCRALARLFRTVGLAAETFPSAKAFLDHQVPAQPMCLILDIRLPGRAVSTSRRRSPTRDATSRSFSSRATATFRPPCAP